MQVEKCNFKVLELEGNIGCAFIILFPVDLNAMRERGVDNEVPLTTFPAVKNLHQLLQRFSVQRRKSPDRYHHQVSMLPTFSTKINPLKTLHEHYQQYIH